MTRKKMMFIFSLIGIFLSLLIIYVYLDYNSLECLLFGILFLFISIIIIYSNDIQNFIIHLFFTICILLFLFSRPFIDYIKFSEFSTYQREAYIFAFTSIGISIISIMIGGIIGKSLFCKEKIKFNFKTNQGYVRSVRLVSLWVFCLSYPFYLIRLIERLIFKINTDYYTYYAEFKSSLPYFTYIISTFMIYSMCVYLATKPKKLNSTIVLILYVFANSIHLLIGTRNPFVLSVIFSFLYYFFRNITEKGKWIGKKEKLLIYVSSPIIILAMGVLNYLRDGKDISINFLNLFVDFIYKQGTSFGVLAKGYLYMSNLPTRPIRNFTLGPIFEYFQKGSIGIYLFNQKPFKNTTNSIELALESNSYSHNISFIDMKQRYLNGHGIGSSYIIEIFTDYGFIGLCIVNIILGILFVWIATRMYKGSTLSIVIALMILLNLFFMPRSSFSESFFNLFTMQFWGIFILIIIASNLINKVNVRRRYSV